MVNARPKPILECLGLAAVLALAAWLRAWHLGPNGFGNDYYAAAVRSMIQNRHNFFFAAFDPAGWVTVDKPPLALWIQALSAKLFGYGPLSLLLPQALEGTAGVAVLYAVTRRSFDAGAALGAAFLLAVTPICVAADRYNNVDPCLVLVLLLAAWAGLRAVERGSWGWTLACAALLGLGFNTKMLAAFTPLPAFLALQVLAAPGSAGRRVRQLVAAGLVLALVSLAWVGAVDLTPASQRPYVGSTQGNSMLELSLGWNGLQRFRGRGRFGRVPDAVTAAEARAAGSDVGRGARQDAAAVAAGAPAWAAARRRGRGGFGGMMGAGEPGPLRLAQAGMAGQLLWFLPLALLGCCAAFRQGRSPGDPASRAGQSAGFAPWEGLRRAFTGKPQRQALLLWLAWLASCGSVLSALRTMHPYYLVLLAPPTAALGGIGFRALWKERGFGRRNLLPAALLLTALWQAVTLCQTPDWAAALLPLLAGGSALGALLLLRSRRPPASGAGKGFALPGSPGAAARLGFGMGFAALLACPLGWALSPVLSPTGDHAVLADPALLTGTPEGGGARAWGLGRSPGVDHKLLAFLEAHRGRARYLVAADNSQAVGPLIIASGQPAVSAGGFMGRDPVLGVDGLAALAHSGALRYFLLNPARDARFAALGLGHGPGGRPGSGNEPGPWGRGPSALDAWVLRHGRPVPPALWRAPGAADDAFRGPLAWGRGNGLQLYDLSQAAPAWPRHGWRRGQHRRFKA